MQKIKKIFLKYFFVVTLLIAVFYLTYLVNFLKYNNINNIELEALKVENMTLKKDNEELRNILSLNIAKDSYEIGQVVLRDLHNFYKEIKVNVKNIEVGNAVLNEKGIVGLVTDIEDDIASVKLLSGQINLSVKINNTYGNLNGGVVSMLDKYADIKENDKVYTSGLTTVPADIYVGEVIKVFNSSDNLGKVAIIKLIDNDNLNKVAVIKGVK